MSTKIRVISADKKAKIGVKGFYNVDQDSFPAMSARAIEAGKKKGLVYDEEYGLVASDIETITAFIEANGLQPLNQVTEAPASSSSVGSKTTAESPNFLEKVRAKLEKLESGKYLNLSSMRPVKTGNKALLYNASLSLAAKLEDRTLFDQTINALGGSPIRPIETESESAPAPSSTRVSAKMVFAKKLYGTPSAINAMLASQPAITPVAESKIEITSDKPLPTSLFAPKKPVVTGFTLAKPA